MEVQFLRAEVACVTLSKLHNPRGPPEEGNDNLFLSILRILRILEFRILRILENPEKGLPQVRIHLTAKIIESTT